MRPAQLADIARDQGYAVSVFRKGLLPLHPGVSEQQLGALFSAYSRG